MFDTEEDKFNFSRQLTVCKFNTIPKIAENESLILTQELVIGDETDPIVAEVNDNIELRYKGWMFEENQTSGKLFANIDSSTKKPFLLKLVGKWLEMLKGLRAGGKRFAVFAPNLKEQLTGILENAPISDNCRYGLQFELVKIQPRAQQKKGSKTQNDVKETKMSATGSEKSDDSNLKSHSNSISDENQPKQKSDMISRVTRMGGLPILPMKSDLKPEVIDTTDSNEDESLHSKPLPKPRNNSNASNFSLTNETQSQTNANAFPSANSSLYSSQVIPNLVSQTIESNLAILTAETRTNQTEIRMNLTKILDKIDSVSEKVSEQKYYSNPQSIGFMDSTILLSSIQRIVTENTNLKKDVEEKTSSLQKLNEKIVDLLHIQSTGGQNSSELNSLRQSEASLRQEVNQLNESYYRIRDQSEDLKSENSRLKQTIKELNEQFQSRPNFDTPSRASKETATQIKRLMNDVFKRISAQLDDTKSYSSDEVIDIVSNSMRSATFAVMDSKHNSRASSPLRQSVDEIDKNKDNLSLSTDTSVKEGEKPPIPHRKSIDQNNKNITPAENNSQANHS